MQPDDAPFLNTAETRWVQSVVGSFMYYYRALDPTIATALIVKHCYCTVCDVSLH